MERSLSSQAIQADSSRGKLPSGKQASPANSLVNHFQRTIGNQALSRLIQAKLQISQPGDEYEQEADHMAEQVMRMRDPAVAEVAVSRNLPTVSRLQRKCAQCGDGGQLSGLQGGGQPLPAPARNFFEPRFGADFGQVRVHADARAAESAQSVNAMAYTVGRDIVFGAGRYQPGTDEGNRLLAHELTHVVQQTGAHRPAGYDVMLQRAISPELEKLEDYLSYGLFDWAITDKEAIKALGLLKTLSRYQQAVFLSNAKYAERLRENLPNDRLAELNEIERNVAAIKPPSKTVEEVRSDLSYGLFDWAITDAEAIAALEKLKKLSGAELGVALGAIDYSRLLDNLPDSRKQELVDLMAQGLATSGARGAEEQSHPGATLSSITFKSDHGLMKDERKSWASSGRFYGEPEWRVNAEQDIVSHPISHNKNESIQAELKLNLLPLAAPAAPVTLRGESDEPALNFNFGGTLQGGMNQKLLLTATTSLPDEIKAIPQKQVRWIMKWRAWEREIARSSHSVFVTMDRPSKPSEVTYKRMAKAVELIGGLHTLVPHEVVRGLMRNWTIYNLGKIYGDDFWELADNIATGAQCIDLVRFVMGLIETVGCPGTATALIIWAFPHAPTTPIETVFGTGGGMGSIGRRSDHGDWFVTLLDGDFHSNNFEAALKFDHGGVLAYYPGGVDLTHAVFSNALQVLQVFNCMAWVKQTGGLNCRIMEVPANYRPGACTVGSEHTCFVPLE